MKTNYLYSLITVILFIYGCHSDKKGGCNNKGRYTIAGASEWDGDTIPRKEGFQWISDFKDSTKQFRNSDDTIEGVFISKQVLDEIFKEQTFNGVFVYFALSGKKEYRMLLEGGTAKEIQLSGGSPNAMYRPKTYCPPTCGSVPKLDSIPIP